MNDNLRYISLQYIKGDNYEDIASFKDNIKWVLIKLKDREELDNTEAVEVLYTRLKEAREEKNKKIGESFLDDLINYSSFNLYKKDLKEAKEKAEEKIKEVKGDVKGDVKENNTEDKKKIEILKGLMAKSTTIVKSALSLLTIKIEKLRNGNRIKLEELVTIQEKIKEDKNKILPTITKDFKKLLEDAIKKVNEFKTKILEELLSDTMLNDMKDMESGIIEDFKINKGTIDEAALIAIKTAIETLEKITAIETLEKITAIETLEKITAIETLEKITALFVKFNTIKSTYLKNNKSEVDVYKKLFKAELSFKNNIYTLEALKKSFETTKGTLTNFKALNQTLEKTQTAAQEAQVAQAATQAAAQADAQAAQEALTSKLEALKTNLEEAQQSLKTLQKLIMKQSQELMSKKREHIDILTKLIALYSSYLNICTKNILKYDRLFEHNEISNIDEAFMIKSYSDFLKKLNKLKENLETKDRNKIMRALMNSLEKLFNMYGINTNNEAAMKAFLENVIDGDTNKGKADPGGKQSKEVDYIIERIINYNLNM